MRPALRSPRCALRSRRPARFAPAVPPLVLAAAAMTLAAAATAPEAGAAQEPFRTETVAPGVHVVLRDEGVPASFFASSVLVVGDDEAVLVDSGDSPLAAARLLATVRGLTDRPVRWLVNTHHHGDHVYGNASLARAFPGLRVVAHAAVRDDLEGPAAARLEEEIAGHRERLALREEWLETGIGPSGEPLTDEQVGQVEASVERRRALVAALEGMELRPPDVAFSDRLELDVGGRRVVLLHPGPAHTGGDAVVHVPDAGVLAVGDLLEDGSLWLEGADVPGWAAALERVRSLEAGVVVPAHGDPRRDRSLLDGEAGFLAAAVAAARAALARGEEPDAADAASLDRFRPVFDMDDEAWAEFTLAAVREARDDLAEGRPPAD